MHHDKEFYILFKNIALLLESTLYFLNNLIDKYPTSTFLRFTLLFHYKHRPQQYIKRQWWRIWMQRSTTRNGLWYESARENSKPAQTEAV